MICEKCNIKNNIDSNFCIGCGNQLVKDVERNVNEQSNEILSANNLIQNDFLSENTMEVKQNSNVVFQQSNEYNSNASNNQKLNYIHLIKDILTHPIKTVNKEADKLILPKNSFILTLIVSGFMTIINLVISMINIVRVEIFSFSGSNTSWNLENLKNINYIELIGKNFLIYFIGILGIAGIFYLGSLIIKKQTNYIKLLSNTAISLIPYALGHILLSPILSLIWSPLGILVSFVGIIYTLLLVYELNNKEIDIKDEKKLYFNLIVFSVTMLAIYYIYINFMIPIVSNDLNNLNDINQILNMFS